MITATEIAHKHRAGATILDEIRREWRDSKQRDFIKRWYSMTPFIEEWSRKSSSILYKSMSGQCDAVRVHWDGKRLIYTAVDLKTKPRSEPIMKFWILTTQSSLDKAALWCDGTDHHNSPGGRFDCAAQAPVPAAKYEVVGGASQRRMFTTLADAIAAGSSWLRSTNGPQDVRIVECNIAGAVTLRESPVVFVPTRRKRKTRKARK